MEANHEDRWVDSKLAALEPQWHPDYAHGRRLLDAGLGRPQGSWVWVAAATAAALLCIAALVIPQTRVFAQQLWYRLVLGRVDVIRVALSNLPLDTQVTANGVQEAVRDLDDAERKAGFRPYLPPDGVLPANPALMAIGLITVEQTIHVREIETALQNVGARDVRVPPQWEGIRLRTEVGPMVAASYPDDVTILQAEPIELSVPSGFSLEQFAEVAFQSIGVSAWDARALAKRFVANPAWLLDIPVDEAVSIEEVSLRSGPGLLIEDFGEGGNVERVSVFLSTNERIYFVSANSRELSLKVADALP